jgi:transcription elongation GreA/GreB family factor
MTKEEREKRIDELLESIKNKFAAVVNDTREMILEEREERKALNKRLETWEYHLAREKNKGG